MPATTSSPWALIEEVAVGAGRAGARVAGEGHAGAGAVVAVAEHHGLHVDGGAEVVGDALAAAVGLGPGRLPAAEHGLDRAAELGLRVLREGGAGVGLDGGLVLLDQRLEGLGRELGVGGHAEVGLGLLERVVERLAGDVEHDAAVHRQEAAVGVEGEALLGAGGEAPDRLVVEAEVEDGVHHPGHREGGAAADAHEQRVGRVAEGAVHEPLEAGDVVVDLGVEVAGPAGGHERPARLGGDGEPGRHRQRQHRGHLGQVGALAAEEGLEVPRGPAVTVGEPVDPVHGDSRFRRWAVASRR